MHIPPFQVRASAHGTCPTCKSSPVCPPASHDRAQQQVGVDQHRPTALSFQPQSRKKRECGLNQHVFFILFQTYASHGRQPAGLVRNIREVISAFTIVAAEDALHRANVHVRSAELTSLYMKLSIPFAPQTSDVPRSTIDAHTVVEEGLKAFGHVKKHS